MPFVRALIGLAAFCAIAWLMSNDRKRFPWRVVLWGIALQCVFALWILNTESGKALFAGMAEFVNALIDKSIPGAAMVFGKLGDASSTDLGFVFAFAGRGLAAIIFFSALMSILYYLGVMQVIVWALARVMTRFLGVSGAESTAMAANIFVGQTEAPLVIKPYLARMTYSELNSVMVGGFANIAGSVMAVYMGMLGTELGPHLITSSVMSAPAAFVIAKIMVPEREQAETAGKCELRIDRGASNLLEAATNGTSDGLKLWLNVIAMLIAFMALVYLIDWPLGWVGTKLVALGVLDAPADGVALSLGRIFGWVLSPLAWLIGVDGWHDCQMMGSLLGTKTALNEFVAYQQLSQWTAPGATTGFEHARSSALAAYALCGFANFASIGIQIGGISPLAPERKADIVKLALRAMIGGAFATWMTATIAGPFLH
jgi:CNT family concentrative nucleoside transporter